MDANHTGQLQQDHIGWASSRRAVSVVVACVVLLSLVMTGCSPYQLQGRIVEGKTPQVLVVNANDKRLSAEPLEGASIELTLDPSSISPQRLGKVVSDENGDFVMPEDAMGAGSFQEYDLGILITAPKHRNIWQTLKLPSAKKRLLVIMATGSAGPPPPQDILKESLQLKDRFMAQ